MALFLQKADLTLLSSSSKEGKSLRAETALE